MTSSKQQMIDHAVEVETQRMIRSCINITRAGEQGRIDEHDTLERIARAEDWHRDRVAWIKGEPRPKQRKRQPLHDPDAGRPK